MKKRVKLSLILSMLILVSPCFSQDFIFKVLVNQGKNIIVRGDSTEIGLKIGSSLFSGDTIKTEKGAYVGLMHSSGATTQLRSAGTFNMNDVEKELRKVKGGIADRYVKYIVNKLNEGPVKKSTLTSAVSRDINLGITVLLPSSAEALGDKAIISWRGPEEANAGYKVIVKNLFDEEVLNLETEKNTLDLNFNEMDNETGIYIMMVSLVDDSEVNSGQIGIKKLDISAKPEVVKSLAGLASEIDENLSPLNKLIYASFYEENNLLLDAITKYEEAMKMSPEIEGFRQLYESFLIKYGVLK